MNVNIFTSVPRNIALGKGSALFFGSGRQSPLKCIYISSATIVSKAMRDPSYKRLPPFPYKDKDYSVFRSIFDRTTHRFDENSKIIVVDGPIAVGKTAFAKQLAEDLDMHFVPEANIDSLYINQYGFDQRSVNDKLPNTLKRTDEKSFCLDPFHITSGWYQHTMLEIRLSMYIDALAHLMNTGQGVVMVRSVYSELVFAEAMAQEKYMRKEVLKAYYDVRYELLPELLRPHLQIYLDIPVPLVQQRIKEKGNSWEINGKALTPSYLQAMEDAYKKKYLPEIEKHAELLIYDWSEVGDMELIFEDIERLDFDKYTVYDNKMKDWRFFKEQEIADLRMLYTNSYHKQCLLATQNIPHLDCPELYITGEDSEIYENLILEGPGNAYMYGYNADVGDKSLWFKYKQKKQQYPYLN